MASDGAETMSAGRSFQTRGVGYCIWYSLQDLVYKGRRMQFANLQDRKETLFENSLHNEKRLIAVKK